MHSHASWLCTRLYVTRIGANAERPEVHASQNPATPSLSVMRSVTMMNQVPTLPALVERCSVLDTVSKRTRTPLRSPICVHGQKCLLVDNARDEIASDMCESSVTSKSHGRVCKLIDLVLSSSTDDTVNVFTESFVLRSSFFPPEPLSLDKSRPAVRLRP